MGWDIDDAIIEFFCDFYNGGDEDQKNKSLRVLVTEMFYNSVTHKEKNYTKWKECMNELKPTIEKCMLLIREDAEKQFKEIREKYIKLGLHFEEDDDFDIEFEEGHECARQLYYNKWKKIIDNLVDG